MKTLLMVVTLLFFTVEGYSQLSLGTLVGPGVKFNSKFDYELYQTAVTLSPGYKIGKFRTDAMFSSVMSDSVVELFSGLRVGYSVWADGSGRSLSVTGKALMGFEGKKLLGGGVVYNDGQIILGLDAAQEYKNKELWLELYVGANLLKPF